MNVENLILTFLVVLTVYLFLKWRKRTKPFDEFPGPRPWIPLLGNTGLLLLMKKNESKKVLNDFLESLYSKYKQEGMFFIFLGHKPALYVHKPEFVMEVIKDSSAINKTQRYDLFKSWLGEGLFTANGQKWKAKRKLLNPSFHLKILENFIPVMNEQIQVMMNYIEKSLSSDYIDVRPLLCNLAFDVISATAMGLSLGVQLNGDNEFVKCSNRSFTAIFDRLYNPLLWNDFLYYLTKAGKQFKSDVHFMHNFTQDVIKKRKQKLREENFSPSNQTKLAFLDLLIANQAKDDSITDDDIREDVDTFMVAGNETTSTALSWIFLLLGTHIDIQQKVKEEINIIFGNEIEREITREDLSKMIYTECVIKEAMRLYPPAPMVARVSSKDIIVNGLVYPKGNSVFINIIKLHLDEETFQNPTKFNPERFMTGDLNKINAAFMPFAAGPRNCIGQRFAMLELKLVLAHVFRRFSMQCLNKMNEVEKIFDTTLRPMNEIRIRFSK